MGNSTICQIGSGDLPASTYGWISERAFCNGLEKGRFANVGKANNTTLQTIAWSSERYFLLLFFLLGRHLASLKGQRSGEQARLE